MVLRMILRGTGLEPGDLVFCFIQTVTYLASRSDAEIGFVERHLRRRKALPSPVNVLRNTLVGFTDYREILCVLGVHCATKYVIEFMKRPTYFKYHHRGFHANRVRNSQKLLILSS